ncbi:hypothetical protein PR202_gb23410 [Eleusine coracana subsp. coracana]|uniref:C2 domain-containing protein n=1 Tax=Eleusine coracana subsp. coracana TaxID=191504 RepID=A0AAV5FG31_ELECO|nr:hypothetical protein PR202_gb23410 [Eleusine coracana subsp. coracana]
MASRYEVEVTVGSARDLKNVNWRNGDLKPYAVLWIDSGAKVSTRVDVDGGESPTWDDKLLVPLPPSSRLDDAVLYVDVVHANAGEGVKSPLVGSARLPLRDILDDAGVGGGKASRTLRLKRPSGRPQGKLDIRVAVKEPSRYYDPNPYPAPGSYASSRDTYAAGGAGYGGGYGSAPPPSGYPAAYGTAQPPSGYPAAYGAAPPQPAYGSAYGAAAAPPVVGGVDPGQQKKGSKMGVGTGVAVGAAAGLLGGLALAGGASYLEDKFEDHVAEKVEENLEREDSYGGGYDDYGGDDY